MHRQLADAAASSPAPAPRPATFQLPAQLHYVHRPAVWSRLLPPLSSPGWRPTIALHDAFLYHRTEFIHPNSLARGAPWGAVMAEVRGVGSRRVVVESEHSSHFSVRLDLLYAERQQLWSRVANAWRSPARQSSEEKGEEEEEEEEEEDEDEESGEAPFIAVLSGLGGIGKTQLALHYALSTGPPSAAVTAASQSASLSPPPLPAMPSYSLRAWFNASSADQLQLAYFRFATDYLQLSKYGPSSNPKWVRDDVRKWLSQQSSWLLVFDDAQSWDDIEPFLPSPSSQRRRSSDDADGSPSYHHVLVTSRSDTWPWHSMTQEVRVDEGMTQSESIELLVKLMSTRQPPPQLAHCLHDADYAELAARLLHYPLAISQAGAHLAQRPQVSLRVYSLHCERQLSRLHLPSTGNTRRDVKSRIIVCTLLTSMQAAADEARQQGMQPVGYPVLTACAYLHPDGIPVHLLDHWMQAECSEEVAAAPQSLAVTLWLLEAYSLLQLDVDKRLVRVHRVLQSVVRQLHCVERPVDDSHVISGRLRFIARSVQLRISRGLCSFEVTQRAGELQEWYSCSQCPPKQPTQSSSSGTASSQLPSHGCCVTCVRSCHAGHALTGPNLSPFYCSCGASELICPCRAGTPAEPAERVQGVVVCSAVVGADTFSSPAVERAGDGARRDRPAAVVLGQLSVSWYARLLEAVVAAHYGDHRDGWKRLQFVPHFDQLQRHYYTHLQPLLRAAGKPCPDVVVRALLNLGQGRRDFTACLASPALAAASSTRRRVLSASTSARGALMLCLAEYERLPHLQTQPLGYALYSCLAEVCVDEVLWEEALAFVRRAHQVRTALPPGTIDMGDHCRNLLLEAQMLGDLSHFKEAVRVGERLVALSKAHFNDDAHLPDDVGVPHCLLQLSVCYSNVGRDEDERRLKRTALRLCEGYCRRLGNAPVPADVQQMIARANEDDNLDDIRQLLGLR